MPELNISSTNSEMILRATLPTDVLTTWFDDPHASDYRYLKLTSTRNCCTDNSIEHFIYPNYVITATIGFDLPATSDAPSIADGVVFFGIDGIDRDLIASATMEFNTQTTVAETLEVNTLTTVQLDSNALLQPYLIGGSPFSFDIEITTIYNQVYTVTYLLTPGLVASSATLAVTNIVYPSLPDGVVLDYTLNYVEYTNVGLNQSNTVLLDGVYNFDVELLSSVSKVESVNQFFNIELSCIVTTATLSNLKDNTMFMLLEALNISNDCNWTVAKQCKVYDSLIRNLIQSGQAHAVKSAGCNCGC